MITSNTGLMWFNRDKLPLRKAIEAASKHFHEKFDAWPSEIRCNPVQLKASGIDDPRIKPCCMVSAEYLHLWGVPERETE